MANQETGPTKLAYGVKDAAAAISMSRAFLFQKIAAGELKSFQVGTRRLIHTDDLKAFVDKYRGQGMEKQA